MPKPGVQLRTLKHTTGGGLQGRIGEVKMSMAIKSILLNLKNNQIWKRAAVLIFGIALVVSALPLEAGLTGDCLDLHSGLATNCSANEGSISGIEVI